jgi:hypothetical protein
LPPSGVICAWLGPSNSAVKATAANNVRMRSPDNAELGACSVTD